MKILKPGKVLIENQNRQMFQTLDRAKIGMESEFHEVLTSCDIHYRYQKGKKTKQTGFEEYMSR